MTVEPSVDQCLEQAFNSSNSTPGFTISLRVIWATGLVSEIVGFDELIEFFRGILRTIISCQ